MITESAATRRRAFWRRAQKKGGRHDAGTAIEPAPHAVSKRAAKPSLFLFAPTSRPRLLRDVTHQRLSETPRLLGEVDMHGASSPQIEPGSLREPQLGLSLVRQAASQLGHPCQCWMRSLSHDILIFWSFGALDSSPGSRKIRTHVRPRARFT